MIDFELIVPEGWVQIPTTPETAKLRKRMIGELVRHHLPETLPRDKAEPWRRMLRNELTAATDEAGRNRARSVLLPLEEFNGFRLPGSMVLTVVDSEDENEDPERLLAAILADAGGDGTYLEIGGSPAVRVAAVIDGGKTAPGRPVWKISYYIANLDAPGVWGLVTFTVFTDGDVLAEPVTAVVLLFDTIVSTLRWDDRIDAPTEDEVLAQLDELAGAGSTGSPNGVKKA